MEVARQLGPFIGLLLGLIGGFVWGSSRLPETPPSTPPSVVCPPSPLQLELRGIELENAMLEAELQEGW